MVSKVHFKPTNRLNVLQRVIEPERHLLIVYSFSNYTEWLTNN